MSIQSGINASLPNTLALDFSDIATGETMPPVHPGEVLREEFLVPLGMTPHALAMALRVPAPRINDIVQQRRGITPDTALRLARYFNTSAEFWLGLQMGHDLKKAAATLGDALTRDITPRAA